MSDVRSGQSACLVDVASEEGIQGITTHTSQSPTMISIAKAGDLKILGPKPGWNQFSWGIRVQPPKKDTDSGTSF